MSKKQTYKGNEIEALLGAAARLQEQEGGSGADGLGLSLEEIEAIARESGIDPEFVRRAALVRETGDEEEDRFHFWGGPAFVRRNLVLNRRLSTTEMERLVPAFRRIMENEGTADSLHDSLSWGTNNRKNQGGTVVMMEAEGDQTICTLKSTVWMPGAFIHYVPLMVTVLIALPIGGQELFSPTALAIKLSVLGLVFLMTRFAYGKLYQKEKRQVDELVSVIEEAARNPQSSLSSEGIGTQASVDSGRPGTVEESDSGLGRNSEAGEATEAAPKRITLEEESQPGEESSGADRGRVRE